MFYSIPCVRNMIAARQMDFIEKMMRGPPDRPSLNMITACCDHKRQVGRPQTTGKNFMVENLRLLFRDVNTVHIDRFGSLRDWINEASNEDYWNQLVKCLLHPDMPIPERPKTWGPLPPWRTQRAANRQCPPDHNADNDKDNENSSNAGSNHSDGNRESHRDEESHGRRQRQHPPLPRRAPPTHKQQRSQFNPPPPAQYNPKQWLNDEDFCTQVGRSMFQSLAILGLGLGASETEIKVRYRQLARKYHPDKNDTAITGLTTSEASTFFQLLNNAHQYLKDRT